MCFLVSDLELRTSGPAGELHGAMMGVYQFHSEDESQGRVYKQRHDSSLQFEQHYLYRSVYHTHINAFCILLITGYVLGAHIMKYSVAGLASSGM